MQRIVSTVHPLRIILFGSAARGEMGVHSDLDVLVVMPEGTHPRKTAQDLHVRMYGVPLAVDIVVATPSILDRYRNSFGLVYREALREGREIYAA
ncbi:MAG: nucleotidyltransferase domain-containing protein [Chloroflexota bacterium]